MSQPAIELKTMYSLTESQLAYIMPHCRYPETWIRPLNQAMERFGIADNVKRMSAFLGQVAHESSQMNRVAENMNYSPQRLINVWPNRFPTLESALPYGRNPERLGNKVYGGRLGNGAENSGDGFRYRGRGLIQITGRDNYVRIGKVMGVQGLVELPDSLLEPRYAALSAAAFWHDANLNKTADVIGKRELAIVVESITKKVNGGTHGLKERLEFTQAALDILDSDFSV